MMLADKDCQHCEKKATVEMNHRFYCSDHAREYLMEHEIPNHMRRVTPR